MNDRWAGSGGEAKDHGDAGLAAGTPVVSGCHAWRLSKVVVSMSGGRSEDPGPPGPGRGDGIVSGCAAGLNSGFTDIDGTFGEGGGQILRTSLALSCVTGRSLRMTRVRGGRSRPGLRKQHLVCVEAARDICGARVSGAQLGSTELVFEPGTVRPGRYGFHIASAGSTTLVMWKP